LAVRKCKPPAQGTNAARQGEATLKKEKLRRPDMEEPVTRPKARSRGRRKKGVGGRNREGGSFKRRSPGVRTRSRECPAEETGTELRNQTDQGGGGGRYENHQDFKRLPRLWRKKKTRTIKLKPLKQKGVAGTENGTRPILAEVPARRSFQLMERAKDGKEGTGLEHLSRPTVTLKKCLWRLRLGVTKVDTKMRREKKSAEEGLNRGEEGTVPKSLDHARRTVDDHPIYK